ncbi:DUF6090 family protein [Aquiflexum gelatinilyticum]|uniref:DUF6090 family protein n=1 Tax=Aquiflexum gelatinilyticum TaxID=2961943 RepID=A0A9X2P5V7_9BACT|nr:DUF6090 family protein [Aquiflexum gelatinilyticum]MCR9015406.1 DUF6090 family protein [Aquiflexum gelatinilyticum]
MIKFFRKIRQKLLQQNKVGSYLKYAIGEIFLLVIGILIALQINNANEAYKARQSERVVLNNLVQDLQADSLSYRENLASLVKINDLHQALYEIGVKGMNSEIENPNLIRFMIYYNPIAINNDPSIASKITSEAIRKEITTYARYLKDLDDAYLQFSDLVEKRIRVYLADKKVHQLSNWFDNKAFKTKGEISIDFIDNPDLSQLSKTPEFQQLILEASIKSKNTEFNLETVLIQNEKLKELIQKELKQ